MAFGRFNRIGLCSVLTILLLSIACSAPQQSPIGQTRQQDPMARKDINDVLRGHDKELMAIPGVVGIYVGLMPDDETLCLKVMVVKETEELKRKIPISLEGYPVLIEESGVIRPLPNKTP
jgi:hypothetical protein